jgi:hypothetical protein
VAAWDWDCRVLGTETADCSELRLPTELGTEAGKDEKRAQTWNVLP